VEGTEIRELTIEFVNDGRRFGGVDVETATVGKDQTFLVQAQMHRVGAQPAVAGHGRSGDFTERSEGGVSGIPGGIPGKTENIAERRFERLRRPTRALAARDQRVQGVAAKRVETFAVVGFGPEEFGYDQGELHGGCGECVPGRAATVEKSVA